MRSNELVAVMLSDRIDKGNKLSISVVIVGVIIGVIVGVIVGIIAFVIIGVIVAAIRVARIIIIFYLSYIPIISLFPSPRQLLLHLHSVRVAVQLSSTPEIN